MRTADGGGWSPCREGFEFVALSWEMDPHKQAPSMRMILQDFETVVVEVEGLFGEYMSLEKRFRMQGRPSKDW